MNRVLLTGATGFVGQHCLPLLRERTAEVHAVCCHTQPLPSHGIHWHRLDLLDHHATEKLFRTLQPSHLLHTAWFTKPSEFWSSPENLRWLESSMTILQQFQTHGGERAVCTGSCAEYDWSRGYCQESSTPLLPATIYGKCKHMLQRYLDTFGNLNGLSTAWARIFFLYGPGAHPEKFPGSIISTLLSDQSAVCSQGHLVRDFLHIADAADALVSLLDSSCEGPINVGSGIPVRLEEMAAQIADQLQRRPLLTIQRTPGPGPEPPVLLADVSRLRNELKWSPRFGWRKGLSDTTDWWERNLQHHAA